MGRREGISTSSYVRVASDCSSHLERRPGSGRMRVHGKTEESARLLGSGSHTRTRPASRGHGNDACRRDGLFKLTAMSESTYWDRTDSFEEKLKMLEAAWKRKDFRLTRALAHSLRN